MLYKGVQNQAQALESLQTFIYDVLGCPPWGSIAVLATESSIGAWEQPEPFWMANENEYRANFTQIWDIREHRYKMMYSTNTKHSNPFKLF